MREWVKSLRLSICIFAGVLTLVGLKIGNLDPGQYWLCAIAVIAVSCATMVQNDWRDRFHDVSKGKNLAHNNPKKFLAFTVGMWIIAIGLSYAVTIQNFRLSLPLWLAITSGLIYSETRKIPMMPIFLVCATSASCALFPIFVGRNPQQVWLLAISVFLVIFGREMTKDLDDVSVDGNYKWTVPQKFGTDQSTVMAGVSIVLGLSTAAMISVSAIWGLPFMLLAAYCLVVRRRYKTSKTLIDAGMAVAIIALGVS